MPQAETTAWVAAVVGDGGSVSANRQLLVDATIVNLKADGIFAKLDRLFLFSAENTQSALRDLVAAALATAVLSPTFTADDGYLGNGTTQYIDTNFNPTTAPSPKFVRDSASLFAWSNTSAGLAGALVGNIANVNAIFPRFTDNNFYSTINDVTGGTAASADGKGFWAANRSASNASQYYKNGSSIATDTEASIAVGNGDFLALVVNGSSFYAGTVRAAGFGQSLTAAEHATLYARLSDYMSGGGYAAFSIPQLDGRTVTQMIGY